MTHLKFQPLVSNGDWLITYRLPPGGIGTSAVRHANLESVSLETSPQANTLGRQCYQMTRSGPNLEFFLARQFFIWPQRKWASNKILQYHRTQKISETSLMVSKKCGKFEIKKLIRKFGKWPQSVLKWAKDKKTMIFIFPKSVFFKVYFEIKVKQNFER